MQTPSGILSLAILLLSPISILAEPSSQRLEELQAEIAPYVLPPEIRSSKIPEINFVQAPMSAMNEVFNDYNVDLAIADSLKDAQLNIRLRNLSVERALAMCTRQVGARWIYKDGRVVIFRNPSELNASYQQVFTKKYELEQLIRAERRQLREAQSRKTKASMEEMRMTEFSVIDSSIKHTIEKLTEATVEERFGANQQGINLLPLFDPKAYPERRSYNFRNRSLRDILDTICEDYRLQWDAGPDAITVSPRR